MKDEVPKVLLNQWLDIKPEKSAFTKAEWCRADSEEYSVYSDETQSNMLGLSSKSLSKKASSFAKRSSAIQGNAPSFAKRNSVLQTKAPETKVVKEVIEITNNRRHTMISRKDTITRNLNAISRPIVEVGDFSEASSSESSSDAGVNDVIMEQKEDVSTGDESHGKSDKEIPLYNERENSMISRKSSKSRRISSKQPTPSREKSEEVERCDIVKQLEFNEEFWQPQVS